MFHFGTPRAQWMQDMKQLEQGFTLVEVVFSVALLSVAVVGLALTIPVSVQTSTRNRVDAELAMLVQRELEQIVAQPLTATSFTDASGNSVSLAAGGNPLASGKIDFTASWVTGYRATVSGISGGQYDLRWNVQALADGGKLFTVGARKSGAERFLLPPVNVSSRVGR